ncbi:MAG TPA: GNAT family N-acetyltransferase [Minicystis sp.]|nr:GNAT family N-acetyltransferase [Minicystis sp.]
MSGLEPKIRRASEADRATVLALLTEHLPGMDVARRYDWLYARNPHGRAVTVVAYEPGTGEPMGVTSLFPRRVLVRGGVRVGSIGGDGFVRPKFRRRGVATALHRACLDVMESGEVEFMYGAPVPNNLRALVRAGSRVIADLQRFARPTVLQRSLVGLARLGGRHAPRLVPLADAEPARVRELCEAARDARLVMPLRDPEHYAWRFGETPSKAQRAYVVQEGPATVAVCAVEHRSDCVGIVDFVAPQDRLGRALWATAAACGSRAVTMLVNRGSPLVPALLECGFFPRETKGFQVLVPERHPESIALFDASRWYFTWGDGDVDLVLERASECAARLADSAA